MKGRFLIFLFVVCVLTITILVIIGKTDAIGPFVVVGIGAFAIFLGTFKQTKNLSFPFWIFTSVAAALYYPAVFTSWGSFNLSQLIVPLLMLIMFGMGTAMSVRDFLGIIKMPKGVLVGLLCQLGIMPLVGFGVATLFKFPPEIAAGIILVGCSPSGLASNVMSYIANANLALSLTLTALATLIAPLTTPFLMSMLADQLVPIDFWAMMWSIVKIVFIPIIAGLLFNHYFQERFPKLEKAMPKVSMVGIIIIIAVITAAGREDLISIGLLLVLACLIHNLSGYFLGYWGAKLFKMDEESCRTIALEVGMQNSGLASGIALEMGRMATMGLGPIVFGPLMNITGSSLAGWWRKEVVTL